MMGDDGPVKLSSWMPPVLGFAVFLVTLLGFGIVVGDWASRNLEMRALVSAVEDSESAMEWADDQIQSIVKEYGANGTLTEDQQTKAWDALSEAAYDGNLAISAAGAQVAEVTVLPWHGDIERAKDAYLAHNQAWQDYMQEAADDPTVLFKEQPEINSTFEAAEPLMKEAVPVPALYDLKARVDAIFTPAPSTTPGQEVGMPVGYHPVPVSRSAVDSLVG